MDRVRSRLVPLAVALSLVVAGCGDDGGNSDSAQDDKPASTATNGTPEEFAKDLADAMAGATTKKRCTRLERVTDGSPTIFPCPVEAKLRRSMRRFELVGAHRYGPVAVVDYKTGEAREGASMVLFVDRAARRWALGRFGLTNDVEGRGDDSRSRAAFGETVNRYLRSVADRDCEAYTRLAGPSGPFGGTKCRPDFENTEVLAGLLNRNRDAEPEYLGGDERFGVHELEFQGPEPTRLTIITWSPPSGEGPPQQILGVIGMPESGSSGGAAPPGRGVS